MTKISDSSNPTSIIQWLGDMANLIDNHGVWKLIKAGIFIFLLVLGFYVIFNFDKVIDKVTTYLNTKHQHALEYRMEIGPQINGILSDLIYNLGASRAFVLEPHNGISNLNGLPFGFINMSYEKTAKNVYSIMSDYRDIETQRFPFIHLAYSNYYWEGNIDDLSIIDDRLAKRMEANDADYLYIVTMHSIHLPIGFVGITFIKDVEIPDKQKLHSAVNSAAQKIGGLLNGYCKK